MLEYILSFSSLFTIRNITSKCAEDEVAPAKQTYCNQVRFGTIFDYFNNWEGGVGQHADFEYCTMQYLENILICAVHCCALMGDGRLMSIVISALQVHYFCSSPRSLPPLRLGNTSTI